MEFTHLLEILKILSPVIAALIAVGGGAYGYFALKASRPKTQAEADKLNAESVVTIADGWQKLYKEVLEKMDAMEKRYEKRIADLEELIREKDAAHAKVVIEKDKRIDELEKRVDDLETELEKYKGLDQKVDDVKSGLHYDVEHRLEDIKHPSQHSQSNK